jgi:hypothetical protein
MDDHDFNMRDSTDDFEEGKLDGPWVAFTVPEWAGLPAGILEQVDERWPNLMAEISINLNALVEEAFDVHMGWTDGTLLISLQGKAPIDEIAHAVVEAGRKVGYNLTWEPIDLD